MSDQAPKKNPLSLNDQTPKKNPLSLGDQTPKKNPLSLPADPCPNGLSLRERVKSLRLPEQVNSSGGGHGGWLAWVLALLFAGSTCYLGVQLYNQPRVEGGANREADRLIAEQIKPSKGPQGEVVFGSKGNVVPFEQILVSPLSGGMLLHLYIEEGKKVKKGDLLGVIDDTEYRAEYLLTKARLGEAVAKLDEMVNGNRLQDIEQAEANFQESEELLRQYLAEYNRNEVMRQRRGVVADSDYDKAKFSYTTQVAKVKKYKASLSLMIEGTRKEKIEAGKAVVDQLKAELIKQKKRWDDCQIRAPVDGTILTKETAAGNFVNPLAFNINSSLCKMADLTNLEIDLTIQEREISKIAVGQKCRIKPDAYPDRMYDGQVSRIMPIADRGKGAVPVRVKVFVPPEEQGDYLKPEMSVFVSFLRVADAHH